MLNINSRVTESYNGIFTRYGPILNVANLIFMVRVRVAGISFAYTESNYHSIWMHAVTSKWLARRSTSTCDGSC